VTGECFDLPCQFSFKHYSTLIIIYHPGVVQQAN
jgi:hypothetical protein